MGGIKNREEKKKLNHVFSSGAGGGTTKGPSVVDKRLKELPCPYCERIFKQVQITARVPWLSLLGMDSDVLEAPKHTILQQSEATTQIRSPCEHC